MSQLLHYHPHSVPPSEPAGKFAGILSRWELEEVSCVGQFYTILLEELRNKIGDNAVVLAMELVDNSKMKYANDSSIRSSFMKWSDYGPVDFDWFSLNCYEDSTKSLNHPVHVEYLATRCVLAMR